MPEETGVRTDTGRGADADLPTEAPQVAALEQRLGGVFRELAHEFGNLIFPLQMLLELQTRAHPLSHEEIAEILRGHVTELSTITMRLRWVGRCLSDHIEPSLEELPVRDLLDGVLVNDRISARTTDRRVELHLDAAPRTLRGDHDLLQQALVELVDNALRFAPVGGGVDVTVRRQGDAVEFLVSDNGPGIAPEIQSHMFEPFVHGDARLNIGGGQLGCGLAIVQRVAAVHGGTAELRRSTVEGTEVALCLPLKYTL